MSSHIYELTVVFSEEYDQFVDEYHDKTIISTDIIWKTDDTTILADVYQKCQFDDYGRITKDTMQYLIHYHDQAKSRPTNSCPMVKYAYITKIDKISEDLNSYFNA